MASAPFRPTKPAAGVMATRPATAPDAAPSSDGLPLVDPFHQRPRHHRRGRGQEGVDEGDRGDAAGFQRRAGVEAEPADPQDRRADHGQGQVVRLDRLAPVADALADHVRADQAGDRGIDVHDGAAGEIQRALGEQEARLGQHAVDRVGAGERIRAGEEPDHVRHRQVGEGEPQHGEQQHAGELHAFGERADDQRAGDAGERALEHEERQFRDVHALGEGRADRRGVQARGEQAVASRR